MTQLDICHEIRCAMLAGRIVTRSSASQTIWLFVAQCLLNGVRASAARRHLSLVSLEPANCPMQRTFSSRCTFSHLVERDAIDGSLSRSAARLALLC